MVKTCPRCRVLKLAAQFNASGSTSDGLQGYCMACMQAATRAWGRSTKYGIRNSVGLELRCRPCDLCGKEASSDIRAHAIDHCHESGAVRGVLCVSCNQGLGKVERSMGGLARVSWYLTRGADYRDVDREAAA